MSFRNKSQEETSSAGVRHVFSVMRPILLIILILLLVGLFPAWPYSTGWGYYPSGGVGLVLLIVLILALTGKL
jgi:Na+/melibiose symporter-like transporter